MRSAYRVLYTHACREYSIMGELSVFLLRVHFLVTILFLTSCSLLLKCELKNLIRAVF